MRKQILAGVSLGAALTAFGHLAEETDVGTVTYGDGYALHVFSEPRTYTFTPTKDITAWVLVVGGGGSGGGTIGGGGGAGGFIEETAVALTAGTTYQVVVGAGGQAVAGGWNTGTNGGDSQFGELIAVGGGAGGSWNAASTSGGSGGGRGNAGGAGSGAKGQGYDGSSSRMGGGGGAGEPGMDAKGGDGLPSFITGQEVYYAGGGGAGSGNGCVHGNGGRGGGGAGSDEATTDPGCNGEDGRGGGGGGGGFNGGNYNRSMPGGNGGSGTVIVRYAYVAGDVPPEPMFNVIRVKNADTFSAEIEVSLSGCGLDATSCSLFAAVSTDGETYGEYVRVAEEVTDEAMITVAGLFPSSAYSVRIKAVNDKDAEKVSSPVSVTTGAANCLAPDVTAVQDQNAGTITFSCTLNSLAPTGTGVLKLLTGPSADKLAVAKTLEVSAAGTFSSELPIVFGEETFFRFEYVVTVGEDSWSMSTDVGSITARDASVYSWSGKESDWRAEGAWNNDSGYAYQRGYPVSGSTAKITADAVVGSACDETVGSLTVNSGVQAKLTANVTVGTLAIDTAATLEVADGAKFALTSDLWLRNQLVVSNDAVFTVSGTFWTDNNGVLKVDNATVRSTGQFFVLGAYQPGTVVEIGGAAPLISVAGKFSVWNGSTVCFDIPLGGYAGAPIQSSNGVDVFGFWDGKFRNHLKVVVAGACGAMGDSRRRKHLVLEWAPGISPDVFDFSELSERITPVFEPEERPTKLYLEIAPKPGLMVIVR